MKLCLQGGHQLALRFSPTTGQLSYFFPIEELVLVSLVPREWEHERGLKGVERSTSSQVLGPFSSSLLYCSLQAFTAKGASPTPCYQLVHRSFTDPPPSFGRSGQSLRSRNKKQSPKVETVLGTAPGGCKRSLRCTW